MAKKKILLPEGMNPEEEVDLTDIADEYSTKNKVKGFFLEEIEEYDVEFIRTGLPGLDYAIGGYAHPGVPLGRIIEIFGGESSGKSTLSLWILGALLKHYRGLGVYFDVEQVYNKEVADKFGINPKKVLVSQPVTIEEVFSAQEELLELLTNKYPDRKIGIIVDSVAATTTEEEYKGDYGDKFYGGIAKPLTQGLRKFNPTIAESKVLCIYINQLREKMNAGMFEEKTDTPGGKGLKFWASVRMECRKSTTIKDDKTKEVIGHTVVIKCKKNKVAPPLKEATFDIFYNSDEFIDYYGHLLDWLFSKGLAGNSKGYYEINGKKYRKAQATELLKSDSELYQELLELAYTVKLEDNRGE